MDIRTIKGFFSKVEEKVAKLALSKQILISLAFGLLFLIDLVVPDIIPFVDEIIIGWLVYSGLSAVSSTIKKQNELIEAPNPLDPAYFGEIDPKIMEATEKELAKLDPILA